MKKFFAVFVALLSIFGLSAAPNFWFGEPVVGPQLSSAFRPTVYTNLWVQSGVFTGTFVPGNITNSPDGYCAPDNLLGKYVMSARGSNSKLWLGDLNPQGAAKDEQGNEMLFRTRILSTNGFALSDVDYTISTSNSPKFETGSYTNNNLYGAIFGYVSDATGKHVSLVASGPSDQMVNDLYILFGVAFGVSNAADVAAVNAEVASRLPYSIKVTLTLWNHARTQVLGTDTVTFSTAIPSPKLTLSAGASAGIKNLSVSGTSGLTFQFQGATNVASPKWMYLGDVGGDGVYQLNADLPVAFYRIVHTTDGSMPMGTGAKPASVPSATAPATQLRLIISDGSTIGGPQ